MSEWLKIYPPFQRRLLTSLGSVLALGFLILWLVIAAGVYLIFEEKNYYPLVNEADIIQQLIVQPDGSLHPERYYWHEPHHLYATPHIDPFFLIVRDAQGHVVAQSQNIKYLQVTPEQLASSGAFKAHKSQLTTANHRLTYINYPLLTADGQTVGSLWIARYTPKWKKEVVQIVALLALFLGVLYGITLLLTRRVAQHTLEPLHKITQAAATLSPDRLDTQVPIPPNADRETALLARTLNAQLQQVAQAFEEIKDFTRFAAHELKTPLTILKGHIEVALRRPRSPERYQKILERLYLEVNHLNTMLHNLLQLTRLDHPTCSFPLETVNLTQCLRSELSRWQQHLQERSLHLSLEPDLLINGHPDLIQEVFHNLIDNAIKFSPPEGTITVQGYYQERQIHIEICNSGHSIPSEILTHIGKRFFRAPIHTNIPGHGLGLALVDKIVQLHQGTWQIVSTPSNGTCVTLVFPAVSHPSQATPFLVSANNE